jgi:trk system potassium uptake protein TrkA
VAKELVENGREVMAVDVDPKIVNNAASYLPVCKCADITDAEVIARLDIGSIDTVIICMASNLEASVMAVTLCKEAGVKTVIVKCANEMHQRILRRVGADRVVFPEKEAGMHLAKNLLSAGFIDIISLSSDVSVVEISVKEEWVGKNLLDLGLRRKYGINVVAVRKGEEANVDIDPQQALEREMTLVVIANAEKLKNL